MTQLVAARNTCFAIVSATEDDLRSLIQSVAQTNALQSEILPTDIRENAVKRRTADLRMDTAGASVLDTDLLPYIDFADISKILHNKISPLLQSENKWITETADQLSHLAPTRNRVCHSRPLEPDDLAKLVEFARRLQSPDSPFRFPAIGSTLARLEHEPTYVLTLQIPQFWNEDRNKVHNNLPVPEFDETGFLGRTADRTQLLKLIRSHYPVVTIIGEGGIGKTALALRCLYDIIDDKNCPFDAVVWISLKTSALTQAGVKTISGSITETLGLFSEVALQLGVPKTDKPKSEAELIQEVAEYLDLYKILIAIDNLETLSTGALRELLLRVPNHSKVLLTSRVGVGEFEARYPLQPLEEKTSTALFRAFARVLGSAQLSKFDEGQIKGYCRRLFHNPLLIKWFVAGVSLGAQPSALLSMDSSEFSSALAFCFENLFDRFGKNERLVIDCLSCARKPLTSAELRFLAPELTDLETETALSALHHSSIVSRSKTLHDDFEYSLSESAQKFIASKAPPSPELYKNIQAKLRELRIILSKESILEARYEYDPHFVRTGSGRDERIAATYLRRALDSLHRGDSDQARSSVQDARRLAPNSAEAWRISGLIEEKSQEFYQATECYELAIQLDPNSRICRYCYAQFLLTDIEDLDGALEQFDAALILAPDAPPLLQGKALTLTRLGRLEDAANIHELLLPDLKSRERRWRLTGADQAADCYRRICFRAWEQKEYSDAKLAGRKAIQIILDSVLRADVDDKLLRRAAKIINEALSKRELASDIEFVEHILATAEKIHDLPGGSSIPIVTEAAWALKTPELLDSHRRRLQALDRYSATPLLNFQTQTKVATTVPTIQRSSHHGKVQNIDKARDFAFIEVTNGKRWFFHRNFLAQAENWTQIQEGTNVSFAIGHNHRGECAVDVEVLYH